MSQAADSTLAHASQLAVRLGIPAGAEELIGLALTHHRGVISLVRMKTTSGWSFSETPSLGPW